MSIYSGFATRNQQHYYDQILYNVISTLLVRISKFYNDEDIEESKFLKIIASQEKALKKLQKRKYLEPKYAEVLQQFLESLDSQALPSQKNQRKNMGRTFSVLDREFKELRMANDNPTIEKGDANSLGKIQEKVKKSRRKIKSKKNSIKANLDVWQFKAEKKQPQLPNLRPNIEEHLLTHSKFNRGVNFSESKEGSEGDQSFIQTIEKQEKARVLSRPPKFRAKMYFKES